MNSFLKKKEEWSALERCAIKHFYHARPEYVSCFLLSGFFAIICVALSAWMDLANIIPGSREYEIFSFVLNTASILLTFFIVVGLSRLKSPSSWSGKFIQRLEHYRPVDLSSYQNFCQALLKTGMQEDTVRQWLDHEKSAIEAEEHAVHDEVLHLSGAMPKEDADILGAFRKHVRSMNEDDEQGRTRRSSRR